MGGPESPDLSSTGPAASPRGRASRSRDDERSTPAGDVETLRPTTLVAAVVGVLAALGVGIAAGHTNGTLLVVGSAVALAVSVRGVASEDPVRIAAGVVVTVVVAAGVVIGVLAGPLPLLVALALAAFGATAVPSGAAGGNRLTEALGTTLYALVPVGVVAVLAVVAESYGPALEGTLGALGADAAGRNLFTTSLLLAGACISTLVALRSLPVVRLAPKRDRERIRRQVVAAERGLRRGATVAGMLVVASTVVWAAMGAETGGLRSVAEPLGTALGTSFVQVPLLAVTGLGVVVAVSTAVVRQAGGSLVQVTRRGVSMGVGVGLAVLLVVLYPTLYSAVLDALGPDVAGVATQVAASVGRLTAVSTGAILLVVGFVLTALLLPAATGVGLAPERAAGAAFGATGLVGAAILASGGVGAPVVFGAVVAGMVVWDLGEFGVGMAEEVGVESAARAEAVHAAAALAVGVVVAVGATLAHAVVTDVDFRGTTALAAVAVVFVGVVLLLSVVRG